MSDKPDSDKDVYTIKEIKDSPSSFLNKHIKLVGKLYYIGSREIHRIRSINLPERESVLMAILKQDDHEITCYFPKEIDLESFNDKIVVVEGELIYIGEEYIMRVSKIELKE